MAQLYLHRRERKSRFPIEGLNKLYGTRIMVSGQTAGYLGGGYLARRLDTVVVKGATDRTVIHELLGRSGEVPTSVRERVEVYEEALRIYLKRDFKGASRLLDGITEVDRPAAILAERCRDYLATPPGQDWDGALHLDSK